MGIQFEIANYVFLEASFSHAPSHIANNLPFFLTLLAQGVVSVA